MNNNMLSEELKDEVVGIVPVFMVGIIWFALQAVYFYNAYKFEKNKYRK